MSGAVVVTSVICRTRTDRARPATRVPALALISPGAGLPDLLDRAVAIAVARLAAGGGPKESVELGRPSSRRLRHSTRMTAGRVGMR